MMEPETDSVVQPKFENSAPETSSLLRLWKRFNISPLLLIAMMKGALPAVIAIAAFQSDAWAKEYGTLGYLTAIMALLGLALQPRAKFLQGMTLNVVFICIGAAISLLQMQVTVAARQNTTGAGPTRAAVGSSGSLEALEYNASANAVAGLCLFIQVYLINVFRAFRPQFNIACVAYAIFTTVASTYAPSFPDIVVCEAFTRQLLVTSLTGLALATGVSLLVFPATLRSNVGKMYAGYFKLTQAFIAAVEECLTVMNLGQHNSEGSRDSPTSDRRTSIPQNKSLGQLTAPRHSPQQAEAVKALLKRLGGLFGKIQSEIGAASQEFAYGNLGSDDLLHINDLVRRLLLPTIGMSTAVSLTESLGSSSAVNPAEERDEKSQSGCHVEILKIFLAQLQQLKRPLQGGLQHIQLVLELAPRPKEAAGDVEVKGGAPPSPGTPEFTAFLERRLSILSDQRNRKIQIWRKERSKQSAETPPTASDDDSSQFTGCADVQELQIMLYLDFMMSCFGTSIVTLAQWADSKQQDGTMSNKRIIGSPYRQLKAILRSAILQDNFASRSNLGEHATWRAPSSQLPAKDPEHLPPATPLERLTHPLRRLPALLRSPESAFGFRAAVATLSIGILAFLSQTRSFFLEQRLQWSLFMIAISMSLDAGHSVFEFFLRIAGTLTAMCASLIIWYICDEKTAAIIPVLFVYLTVMFYFVISYPQYLRATIISIMSAVLIVGYELQVRKLGVPISTAGGQPAYPIYELAPYRLACVVGGLLVAFFWVYFPYPVQTQSLLRQDLAAALHLLAKLSAAVTAESRPRSDGLAMDADQRGSLAETKRRLFVSLSILLPIIRERAQFTRFSITFGGRFPRETYDELVQAVQRMFNHTMLVAYASAKRHDEESEGEIHDLNVVSGNNGGLSTSPSRILSLLAASMSSGNALPAQIRVDVGREAGDEVITSARLEDPALSARAVGQVCMLLFREELGHAVGCVKDLVGEMNSD